MGQEGLWSLRVPPYQQNMAKVETELHSPAFSPRTEKWKDHARELAKLDPLKVLESLHKLKEDAAQKLERQVLEAKPTQTSHQQQNTKEDTYLRFKTLHEALKDNPHQTLTKELKHLAKELSEDKDFMKELNQREKQEAKFIERMVQEKVHTIALERDRGGMSL